MMCTVPQIVLHVFGIPILGLRAVWQNVGGKKRQRRDRPTEKNEFLNSIFSEVAPKDDGKSGMENKRQLGNEEFLNILFLSFIKI